MKMQKKDKFVRWTCSSLLCPAVRTNLLCPRNKLSHMLFTTHYSTPSRPCSYFI